MVAFGQVRCGIGAEKAFDFEPILDGGLRKDGHLRRLGFGR